MIVKVLGFTVGFVLSSTVFSASPVPTLHRDGKYWVESIQGSEPAIPGGRLRVTTTGNVVWRGQAGGDIRYTLTRRVQARSETEARSLLKASNLVHSRSGRTVHLIAPSLVGNSDLRISGPRGLHHLFLSTPGGSIDAADLDGSLSVENGAGKIAIQRVAGDVDIRSAGGATSLNSIGGRVSVMSAGGGIDVGSILGAATFQTGGGDIVVQQVGGMVQAFTGGGEIRIIQAGDAVFARTAGGPIEIERALGLVTARNAGGPIRVGAATGVHCESDSGTIRLTNISGSMRASTAAGSIVAEFLSGRPVVESVLSTGSGDITVFIPSNVGVTVHAQNNGSGNPRAIVSDYSAIRARTTGFALVADGKVNGGGPLLSLAGSGGRIFIKRK